MTRLTPFAGSSSATRIHGVGPNVHEYSRLNAITDPRATYSSAVCIFVRYPYAQLQSQSGHYVSDRNGARSKENDWSPSDSYVGGYEGAVIRSTMKEKMTTARVLIMPMKTVASAAAFLSLGSVMSMDVEYDMIAG